MDLPIPDDHPLMTPVMLRRELVRGPYDDRAIARAVQRGELVKVRRGAYVAAAAHSGLDVAGRHGLRARAVVRQAKTTTALSHVSALPFWGCPTWGFDLGSVHLTRSDGRAGRREAGVAQHCGTVLEGDLTERSGVLTTSPARLALEVTMLGRTEAALCVVNDLLHRGLVTMDEITHRYLAAVQHGGQRGMRHWPHSLTTEHVLRLADGRLESVGESRGLHLLWQAGLPLPVPQWEIRDETGRVVARLDFAWPDLGVWMEFDGKVKYAEHLRPGEDVTAAVLREKRREQEVVELTGWRPIRADWADLAQPTALASRVRRLLFPAGRAA